MSTLTTTKIDRIRALAAELDQLGRTALEKAIEAGNLLTECKAAVPHGEWLPWLESNFAFTDRTARRWMKVSEDSKSGKLKSDTVSNLAEAYRITTDHKPEKCEFESPFQMPPLGHRMFLIFSEIGSGDFATIEPMDETYCHVTYTDLLTGGICGAKRGVRTDRAWWFLTHASGKSWDDAVVGYLPWEPSGMGDNPNLTAKDPIAWIPKDPIEWIPETLYPENSTIN